MAEATTKEGPTTTATITEMEVDDKKKKPAQEMQLEEEEEETVAAPPPEKKRKLIKAEPVASSTAVEGAAASVKEEPVEESVRGRLRSRSAAGSTRPKVPNFTEWQKQECFEGDVIAVRCPAEEKADFFVAVLLEDMEAERDTPVSVNWLEPQGKKRGSYAVEDETEDKIDPGALLCVIKGIYNDKAKTFRMSDVEEERIRKFVRWERENEPDVSGAKAGVSDKKKKSVYAEDDDDGVDDEVKPKKRRGSSKSSEPRKRKAKEMEEDAEAEVPAEVDDEEGAAAASTPKKTRKRAASVSGGRTKKAAAGAAKKKPTATKRKTAGPAVPRPGVKVIDVDGDSMSDSKELRTGCCGHCTAKELVRAVRRNDLALLKSAIDNREKVFTVRYPWDKWSGEDALCAAIRTNNVDAIKLIGEELKAEDMGKAAARCSAPSITLDAMDTGSYSKFTFGHKIKKLNASRGGKEGNNAFVESFDDGNDRAVKFFLKHPDVKKETIDALTTYVPEWLQSCADKVVYAIQAGQREKAGYLIKLLKGLGGWGFNWVHENVLLFNNEPLEKPKIPSVTKKPQENAICTPIHCAATNPNPIYLSTLLSLVPEYGILDNWGRRPVHYAAACTGTGPLEFLLSHHVDFREGCQKGITPLMTAARYNRNANLKILLAAFQKLDEEAEKEKAEKEAEAAKTAAARAEEPAEEKEEVPLVPRMEDDEDEGDAAPIAKPMDDGFQIGVQTASLPAAITARDSNGHTALVHALLGHNLEGMRLLVAHGSDTMTKNKFGQTLLHQACIYALPLEIAKYLVEELNISVNSQDAKKKTPLIYAIEAGNIQLASYLINQGVDVDLPDSSNNYPIHYAAAFGWIGMIKLLLSVGADPNVLNDWKVSPLSIAMQKGHYGCAEYLLETDVDVNLADDKGRTLLSHLVENPSKETLKQVQFLITKKGAAVNTPDTEGNTALHYLLSARGKVEDIQEILQVLLAAGADVSVENQNGETPLIKALSWKSNSVFAIALIKAGSAILPKAEKERHSTLLHHMIEECTDLKTSSEILEAISGHKDFPALSTIYDEFGQTPLHTLINNADRLYKSALDALKRAQPGSSSDIHDSDDSASESEEEEEEEEDGDVAMKRADKPEKKESLSEEMMKKKALEQVVGFIKQLLVAMSPDPNLPVAISQKTLNCANDSAELRPLTESRFTGYVYCNNCYSGKYNFESGMHKCPKCSYTVCADCSKALIHCGGNTSGGNRRPMKKIRYGGRGIYRNQETNEEDEESEAFKKQQEEKKRKELLDSPDAPTDPDAEKPDYDPMSTVGHSVWHLLSKIEQPELLAQVIPLFFNLPGRKELDVQSKIGMSALHTAIEAEAADLITALVQAGASLSVASKTGTTPLILACQKGSSLAVKQMVENAPANKLKEALAFKDIRGRTALHYARDLKTVSLLLKAGANPNALDDQKRAPLHFVVNFNNSKTDASFSVEAQLIASGANASLQDYAGRTPLHYAFVKMGKSNRKGTEQVDPMEVVSGLCSKGAADVNLVDKSKKTALHYAAQHGATVSSFFLLTKGANLEARDKNGNSPLGIAVLSGHSDYAVMLTQRGASPKSPVYVITKTKEKQEDGSFTSTKKIKELSLFRYAVEQGWQGVAHMLIESKFPLPHALHDALQSGKLNISLSILRRVGSPKELADQESSFAKDKMTFIHTLASCTSTPSQDMQIEVLDALLAGAMIGPASALDKSGRTVLHHAAKNQHIALCKAILEKALCPVDQVDTDGYTALGLAIEFGAVHTPSGYSVAEILLEHKASPNFTFPDHSKKDRETLTTPLIHAVRKEAERMLDLLLKNGADACKPDSLGRTPLMYAVRKNNMNLFHKLIASGAAKSINAVDAEGKTIVHHVVNPKKIGSYENTDMLKVVLTEFKADPKIKDSYGHTAFWYALLQESGEMAKKFRDLGFGENFAVAPARVMSTVNDWPARPVYEEDAEDFLQKVKAAGAPEEEPKPQIDSVAKEQLNGTLSVVNGADKQPMDILMTKVELRSGRYGTNMFYRMQVLKNEANDVYILWTRWGRVGDQGQYQQTPFPTKPEAEKEFNKILKAKGKTYTRLQIDNSPNPKEYITPFSKEALAIKSPLLTAKPFASFLGRITNSAAIVKQMSRSGINTALMPLGNLKREVLQEAMLLLKKILTAINAYEAARDATPLDASVVRTCYEEIVKLSNQYYQLIPHGQFRGEAMSCLESSDAANREVTLIDSLLNIEAAAKILLGAQLKADKMNPLEYCYRSLDAFIEPLPSDSAEAKIIKAYGSNTGCGIKDVFRVQRKGEPDRMAPFKALPNHYLLWHGSADYNLMGILSTGLRVAPIEAQACGCNFGKGIYFADQAEKSRSYSTGIMLLCEVALGKMSEHLIPFYTEKAEEGFDSVIGLGSKTMDLSQSLVLPNGVRIPTGKPQNRVWDAAWKAKFPDQYRFQMGHNEYIVYNPAQVRIRYIVTF